MIRAFYQVCCMWFVASSILVLFLWGLFELIVTVGVSTGVRRSEVAVNAFGAVGVLFLFLELCLVCALVAVGIQLADET